MIQVTRLNRTAVVLNSDLIEEIEATPDTVVSLTTGQKIVVLESAEEIIERVVSFRRSILLHPGLCLPENAQMTAREVKSDGVS